MARLSNFSITFEVEPIVKVLCEEIDCEHNLAKPSGWLACNLKYICILPGGFCRERKVKMADVRDGEQS
jgi:hypothetical protein